MLYAGKHKIHADSELHIDLQEVLLLRWLCYVTMGTWLGVGSVFSATERTEMLDHAAIVKASGTERKRYYYDVVRFEREKMVAVSHGFDACSLSLS